jgi:hypothetical protein
MTSTLGRTLVVSKSCEGFTGCGYLRVGIIYAQSGWAARLSFCTAAENAWAMKLGCNYGVSQCSVTRHSFEMKTLSALLLGTYGNNRAKGCTPHPHPILQCICK